jgi:hypothetical protein
LCKILGRPSPVLLAEATPIFGARARRHLLIGFIQTRVQIDLGYNVPRRYWKVFGRVSLNGKNRPIAALDLPTRSQHSDTPLEGY